MSTIHEQLKGSLALIDEPKQIAVTLPMYDNPTPAQLMQLALAKDSAIDVIERVAALMEKERDYQARLDFDSALNACQKAIGRIAPDKQREHNIWWATYPQIDRKIRPIYTEAGFSIDFTEGDSPEGRMRVLARLSRGSVVRDFKRDVPVDGNKATSRADAEAAAYSRGQRYLLLSIFNIAIGIDADEQKPHTQQPQAQMGESTALDMLAAIEGSGSVDELQRNYFAARDAAQKIGDSKAAHAFAEAKNKRYIALNKKGGR